MMIRRFAMLLAVVLLALGVPVTAAGAHPAPDPVCNTTTSPDGVPAGAVEIDSDVKLHHDLACDLWTFEPRGGSITVNLNGHTVDSVFDLGEGTIRVVNGTVKSTVGALVSLVLKRVHVMGDVRHPNAFPLIEIHDSTIDGLVEVDNSGIIDHSVIGNGIHYDDEEGAELTITHNRVSGGIELDAIEFPDTYGLIADNTLVGAGIDISDAANVVDLTIRHNTVIGSPGDGIVISSACTMLCISSFRHQGPITIRGNRTIGNGGHGINIRVNPGVLPGVIVDGGKNVASGNALDPQCVGVVCKP